MNARPLPPKPTHWPHDKLAKVNVISGAIILSHPDRRDDTRQLNTETWSWVPIPKINHTEQVAA